MNLRLGTTVMTKGIASEFEKSVIIATEIMNALERHRKGDWGDLCDEDKEANEYALINNERIFSTYNLSFGKIYIITEWNRYSTTILLPEEY